MHAAPATTASEPGPPPPRAGAGDARPAGGSPRKNVVVSILDASENKLMHSQRGWSSLRSLRACVGEGARGGIEGARGLEPLAARGAASAPAGLVGLVYCF